MAGYTMTAFLDGYCLNTEGVKETKGVCFDNLTFSSRPEVSSLSPWASGVEEGGTEQEGPGGLPAKRREYRPFQCLSGFFFFFLYRPRALNVTWVVSLVWFCFVHYDQG